MSYDPTKQRVMKEVAKKLMFNTIRIKMKGKSAKKVLLLPGENCADLKEGLIGAEVGGAKYRPWTSSTHFVLIEREKSIAKKIKKQCKELGLKSFEVINQEVADVSPADIGNDFDIVFLDFCGQLTEKLFLFLYNLEQQNFQTKIMGLTFETLMRQNTFFKNNSTISKWFRRPKDDAKLGNVDGVAENADWACDKTLLALGLRCSSIIECIRYKEPGPAASMVTFFLDQSKTGNNRPDSRINEVSLTMPIGRKEEVTTEKAFNLLTDAFDSAGKKAAFTRKLRALQRAYNNEPSSGKRAWIKRSINEHLRIPLIVSALNLQDDYKRASSAGVKAGIKRKINALCSFNATDATPQPQPKKKKKWKMEKRVTVEDGKILTTRKNKKSGRRRGRISLEERISHVFGDNFIPTLIGVAKGSHQLLDVCEKLEQETGIHSSAPSMKRLFLDHRTMIPQDSSLYFACTQNRGKRVEA
jgi:hypothetical protein